MIIIGKKRKKLSGQTTPSTKFEYKWFFKKKELFTLRAVKSKCISFRTFLSHHTVFHWSRQAIFWLKSFKNLKPISLNSPQKFTLCTQNLSFVNCNTKLKKGVSCIELIGFLIVFLVIFLAFFGEFNNIFIVLSCWRRLKHES